MTDPVRFSENLTLRAAPDVTAAVDRAARAQGTRPSEYVRRAVRKALESDGFDPVTIPARDAGALYDSQEGQQRYAKIEGDQIKFVSYAADHPGEGWLPVVHADAEPFDLATQWRLAPVYTIEPERVVCTYPVVAKSLEAM